MTSEGIDVQIVFSSMQPVLGKDMGTNHRIISLNTCLLLSPELWVFFSQQNDLYGTRFMDTGWGSLFSKRLRGPWGKAGGAHWEDFKVGLKGMEGIVSLPMIRHS